MSEWKDTELRNHILYKKGFAFKSSSYKHDGRLIVRVSNTTYNSINVDSCVRIEENLAVQYQDYELDTDDVVIMSVGSWPDNPASVVGKVIRVPKYAKKALLNQNAVRIRSNGTIHTQFLYYKLKSNDFSSYIINNAQGSANQASITLEDIFSYKFGLPSVPEQTAIASVLSSLDDKIDLLHRQNATLEKMAETLFRQRFLLGSEGQAGVDEAKVEWGKGKLGDFIQPRKGKNITKTEAIDGIFPVVAGGLEPSYSHNQSNTKAPVVTVSASGANAGFVRLYNSPVWSSDSSYIDETITPYVYFYYIFLRLNQEILFDKQEGSAQPHIYPSHIMEIEMPHLADSMISNYENEVNPMFQKIKSNQTQIIILSNLRDTLLPKLMSGDVRVQG